MGLGAKRQGQEERRGKQKKENGGAELKETRIKGTIENREWRVKKVTEKKNKK